MEKKIIQSELAPAPIGPYSQAVLAGNMLFVSGQIPLNQATGEMEQQSIEAETEMVMQNLSYILQAAGSSFDKVVKCSIFVTDMNNFAKVNAVYGKYFSSNEPARETVEICALPKGANVEISCIALV